MRKSVVVSALCAISFCVASDAWADETIKFRNVFHAMSVQTQEVGDVDGHTLGVAHYSGLASFADGSVGTSKFTGTTDYIKGAGTYSIYFNVTLRDGSSLWFKAVGPSKPEGTTTVFPETGVTILRGTGRFEGAKGDGTLSGARLGQLATGAELYNDVVLNVKK